MLRRAGSLLYSDEDLQLWRNGSIIQSHESSDLDASTVEATIKSNYES